MDIPGEHAPMRLRTAEPEFYFRPVDRRGTALPSSPRPNQERPPRHRQHQRQRRRPGIPQSHRHRNSNLDARHRRIPLNRRPASRARRISLRRNDRRRNQRLRLGFRDRSAGTKIEINVKTQTIRKSRRVCHPPIIFEGLFFFFGHHQHSLHAPPAPPGGYGAGLTPWWCVG